MKFVCERASTEGGAPKDYSTYTTHSMVSFHRPYHSNTLYLVNFLLFQACFTSPVSSNLRYRKAAGTTLRQFLDKCTSSLLTTFLLLTMLTIGPLSMPNIIPQGMYSTFPSFLLSSSLTCSSYTRLLLISNAWFLLILMFSFNTKSIFFTRHMYTVCFTIL